MNLRHQSSRDVTYSNQREITRMKDADFDLKPADSQKKNFRKQHQSTSERRNEFSEKTIQRHTSSGDQDAVQEVVHSLHEKRTVKKQKQLVTMPKLQQALKEKDIDVSLSTVKRTVKRLGFWYSKKGSQSKWIKERQDIVSWRHSYLRKVRKYRQEGRNIVYLDRTWLNTNHVVNGDWLDHRSTSLSAFEPPCKGCGRVLPTGKGTRLIFLDAGSSEQGLIPGCGLIFESKTSSSDYHDEMNKEHFTEWFKDTLLPKLPPQSVIVMDNAPYHSHLVPESRVPNTGSRKPEILAWLDRNNIDYPENAIKAELLEFVKQNKPRPKYVIDELAAEHDHEVLRLPPRHCELNPIEMVWADLKGYVARRNSTYKKKDIIDLFNEAKSRFNKERWAKFETHVSREVEEKLWLVDGIRDDENIPYIIDMTEDDNDDSDIDDDLDEGEGNDMEIDSDLEYYLSDGINNSDVSKLCDICQAATPPKQKKRDKEVQWFQCVYCKRWLHEKCREKCRKGAARKGDMCSRCQSILRHKDLSTQLLLEPMDTET
ncbi:unnamed protein product [Mytilus coruscus]|uniref:Tc1-like transposase DDE domain-containing protein n=1 Tax=Mytilus coruscus TaxID=42192 RepID=A0A6J8B5B7_MYTCO|nr:unnamed protein product [Mytilus coruscus]